MLLGDGQRGANQVSIDTNSAMVTPGSGHPITSGLLITFLHLSHFMPGYLIISHKPIKFPVYSSLPSSEIHKKLAVFPEIGIR